MAVDEVLPAVHGLESSELADEPARTSAEVPAMSGAAPVPQRDPFAGTRAAITRVVDKLFSLTMQGMQIGARIELDPIAVPPRVLAALDAQAAADPTLVSWLRDFQKTAAALPGDGRWAAAANLMLQVQGGAPKTQADRRFLDAFNIYLAHAPVLPDVGYPEMVNVGARRNTDPGIRAMVDKAVTTYFDAKAKHPNDREVDAAFASIMRTIGR
jgi:hypothetical protein